MLSGALLLISIVAFELKLIPTQGYEVALIPVITGEEMV